MAEHNDVGKIGESIAKAFLMKQGFSILGTNYLTRYGELDIITKKDTRMRFIEVKSIKVRSFDNLDKLGVRPEDNLTSSKLAKLKVSIEVYLNHQNVSHETKYQIDLACVYINPETREAKVKLIENIHSE
ncbi:MAG: hypothetical protein JWN37_226 [Candidatus Nomurabacteria bacterium]|nr:hypothetical protein [Candidatus Nomurabacteria bacterium]